MSRCAVLCNNDPCSGSFQLASPASRKDNLKKKEDFTGYDMYDLIMDKFDVSRVLFHVCSSLDYAHYYIFLFFPLIVHEVLWLFNSARVLSVLYMLIPTMPQVPYDVQINKTVWMGKPVLCFNIMWK